MSASAFTPSFLRLFSGPIIWAIHFLVIYGFTGIMCARPALRQEWFGISLTAWFISVASVMAIAAITVIHANDWRARLQAGEIGFLHWMASGLALLSVIAIVWEALPVLLVPECA